MTEHLLWLWNSLLLHVKAAQSKDTFKSLPKIYFFYLLSTAETGTLVPALLLTVMCGFFAFSSDNQLVQGQLYDDMLNMGKGLI